MFWISVIIRIVTLVKFEANSANAECGGEIVIPATVNFSAIRGQVSALNKFCGAKALNSLQGNYWFRKDGCWLEKFIIYQ